MAHFYYWEYSFDWFAAKTIPINTNLKCVSVEIKTTRGMFILIEEPFYQNLDNALLCFENENACFLIDKKDTKTTGKYTFNNGVLILIFENETLDGLFSQSFENENSFSFLFKVSPTLECMLLFEKIK